MSLDSSFTLCPSNSGAFGSYSSSVRGRGFPQTTTKIPPEGSSSAPTSPATSASSSSPSQPTMHSPRIGSVGNGHKINQAMEQLQQPHPQQQQHLQPQHRLIAGTLLQDWMLPSHNLRRFAPSARSIRASPFEPLVHRRNLPKSGHISPLQFMPPQPLEQGYPAPPPMMRMRVTMMSKSASNHINSHQTMSSTQPHRIPIANSMPPAEGETPTLPLPTLSNHCSSSDNHINIRTHQNHHNDHEEEATSAPPPIAEIRIPTPQTLQAASSKEDDDGDNEEDEDNDDEDSDSCAISHSDQPKHKYIKEDFKTLYLCCQRDLHATREHLAQVAEENRLLKRHFIQLQRQLYACHRNKRPCTDMGPAWTIPESTCNSSSNNNNNRCTSPHKRARTESVSSAPSTPTPTTTTSSCELRNKGD